MEIFFHFRGSVEDSGARKIAHMLRALIFAGCIGLVAAAAAAARYADYGLTC